MSRWKKLGPPRGDANGRRLAARCPQNHHHHQHPLSTTARRLHRGPPAHAQSQSTVGPSQGYEDRTPATPEGACARFRCCSCWVDLYAHGLPRTSGPTRRHATLILGPSHCERKSLTAARYPWAEVEGDVLEFGGHHALGVAWGTSGEWSAQRASPASRLKERG